MKKIASAVTALIVSVSSLPVGFAKNASTANPTVEPKSVFVRGPNPEWSKRHLLFHARLLRHRSFHTHIQTQHRKWHARVGRFLLMASYRKQHRLIHRLMNAVHRRAHNMQVNATSAHGRMPVPVGQPLGQSLGSRPSKRQIERDTLERMQSDFESRLRGLGMH